MKKNIKQFLSEIGKIGGQKTAKIWGISHYSRIGKLGANMRYAKKTNPLTDLITIARSII